MRYLPLILVVLCSVSFITVGSAQYMYPVASFIDDEGATKVYVVHQKTPTSLALLEWDPLTKDVHPALHAIFNPAALSMLPDGSGFSFIDDGRIRIKRFNRRSPKSLDVREPLYDIGQVRWINKNHGYFCAKERGNYGIFQINMQADVERIVGSAYADYMFPCKVESMLFYVERSHGASLAQSNYAIVAATYPYEYYQPETPHFNDSHTKKELDSLLREFEDPLDHHITYSLDTHTQNTLINFGQRPIVFLQMVSTTEGFFLEHPSVIDKQSPTIPFICHHISQEHGMWSCTKLFDFNIPTHLLFFSPNSCLYESLLPLVPRLSPGSLFFVDCGQGDGNLSLFEYSIATQRINKRSPDGIHGLFFGVLLVEDVYYYGGQLTTDAHAPQLFYGEAGNLKLDLPFFK